MASAGVATTLFDYVVVVAVRDGAPYVKWCFPPGREKDALVENIKQFCFPDIEQYPKSKVKAETFSFVLTESDGAKRWGYCRRMLEPGEGKRYPQCFCIVSPIPCFSIFSTLLSHVIQRGGYSAHSLNYCSVLLDAIHRQPLPPPGGSFSVTIRSLVDAKPENFFFTRPDDSDSMFDYVNFEPLLHMLDAINVISVFTSLLIERRVIFIADELPVLSSCVQAAVALLYPFSWQHVYIPVLPSALLTFCCAPMPFVVGVLRTSVGELNKMADAMEEVAIVDIDRNKFLSDTSAHDFGLLPGHVAAPLLKAVAGACKSVKSKYSLKNRVAALKDKKARSGSGSGIGSGGSGADGHHDADKGKGGADKGADGKGGKMLPEDARNLANAFIAFFVDLMGNYRSFIVSSRDPTTGQTQLKFDKAAFLDDQPPDSRRLMEMFVESQMFEVFIQERAKTQRLNTGKFEQRVTMYMQQALPLNDVGGSVGRKAVSRFTMYENGEISREEITKTVNQMLESNAATSSGAASWTPSTSVLLEGTLTKLGGHTTKLKLINRGNWHARWCQLTPTHLVFFKCRGDARPSGEMSLKDMVSVSFTGHHDLLKKSNCLEIQTPGRAYYMLTETADDGDKWCQAISRARQNLAAASAPPMTPSPGAATAISRGSPSVGRRPIPAAPAPGASPSALSTSLPARPPRRPTPPRPPLATSQPAVHTSASSLPSPSAAPVYAQQSNSDRAVRTRLQTAPPGSLPPGAGAAAPVPPMPPPSPPAGHATMRPARALPPRPTATYVGESPLQLSGGGTPTIRDDGHLPRKNSGNSPHSSGSPSLRGPSPSSPSAAAAAPPPVNVRPPAHITMRAPAQRATIQAARTQHKTNSDDVSAGKASPLYRDLGGGGARIMRSPTIVGDSSGIGSAPPATSPAAAAATLRNAGGLHARFRTPERASSDVTSAHRLVALTSSSDGSSGSLSPAKSSPTTSPKVTTFASTSTSTSTSTTTTSRSTRPTGTIERTSSSPSIKRMMMQGAATLGRRTPNPVVGASAAGSGGTSAAGPGTSPGGGSAAGGGRNQFLKSVQYFDNIGAKKK